MRCYRGIQNKITIIIYRGLNRTKNQENTDFLDKHYYEYSN